MVMDRAVIVLAVSVMVVAVIRGGQAKRGCASFGHSCYGGMGKRSELENANEEAALQNNVHHDNENPAYVFTGPRSFPISGGLPIRPFRYNRFTPEQYEQMSKFVREWIVNSLRREEETENN